jgi:hypothetical protein
MVEESRALSVEDQEYERLVNAGMQQSGEQKKRGIYVPTVEMSNSIKEKNGISVPVGHFRFTEKKDGAKVSEDYGNELAGVILKVRYSFESQYDPTGKAPYFFSQEFDTYQDYIKVLTLDANKKVAPYFEGTYKQWLEQNSFEHPQTKKRTNLFDTSVNLYVLANGNVVDPQVYKLKLGGKAMGNYFQYMNGNPSANIPALHQQRDSDGKTIHLHTHLHVFTEGQYIKPDKSGYYASVDFKFADRLTNADIIKVVNMQHELSEALRAMEGGGKPAVIAEVEDDQGEIQESLPTIQIEDEEKEPVKIAPVEGSPYPIDKKDVPFE